MDIIIPCLNESHHLTNTLKVLTNLIRNNCLIATIILVDNGSTDNSCEIAMSFCEHVAVKTGISIGALRNYGVSRLKGEYLVFLDADIEITPPWICTLFKFISDTEQNKMIISGFPYQSPVKKSYIEKVWFNNPSRSTTYINSGNLITTRKLFNSIGGFDSKLTTGEDWDFCQRAKKNGGIIKPMPDFLVYHHGYPKTITKFFLRELWHGIGDYQILKNFFKSKPAILASLTGFFTIVWFVALIVQPSLNFIILLPIFLVLTGTLFAIKRSKRLSHLPFNIILSIVYFYARCGSLLLMIWRHILNKKLGFFWRWR
ncbi:MAG: glycosyltransferase [Desulfobacula sp.]|uniref:glycosyltransferase family 2 protein n=1 Tax=Desulfobacula sp. TaxID=2593537 RepID=UPI001DE480E8|nr:glycosyltransferase [Desulfobacula sp.]MBT4026450.1 glycosyltransferase [Desulfobacula sp.]MBT4200321.1 glycosyltransferase [Desulfobacula sp.]MBT4508466.1 glycosyltransferase [Desulfobacula sp.]MBT4877933.1 glycosyltransferase [Desulfobacula sp.]